MPAGRFGKWAAGLLGLQLFILLSATGTGAEKPGVCPQLLETADCVKECASDDQCKDNHKCCQAGCSFVCSTPNGLSEGELSGELSATSTTTPSADPAFTISLSGSQVSTKPPSAVTSEEEKEGTCPSVDLPKLGLCEDQCKVDGQCPDNKKCCRNGCGKMTCTTPKF